MKNLFLTVVVGISVLVIIGFITASGRADESLEEKKNLVVNPGFEIDRDKDGMPDGWRGYNPSKENAEFKLSQEEVHTGKASAYIKGKTTGETGKDEYHGGWQQYIEGLSPNTTYRCSAYVKTKRVSKFRVTVLYLDIFHGGKIVKGFPKIGRVMGKTKDWTYVEITFTTPAEFSSCCLYPVLAYNQGEVWIDDVSLTEVKSTNLAKR